MLTQSNIANLCMKTMECVHCTQNIKPQCKGWTSKRTMFTLKFICINDIIKLLSCELPYTENLFQLYTNIG